MKPLTLKDVLLQDFWIHLAGMLVITSAFVDLWGFHQLSHDTDLLLIVSGVAGMGLKIVNGSAAALRQVALDTAFTAKRTAEAAAAVIPSPPPPPAP